MDYDLKWILVNSYKSEIITFLEDHPEYFNEMVELAIADQKPYSWRAAWALWSCMQPDDRRLKPYINQLIRVIPERNENHKREVMKILEQMMI